MGKNSPTVISRFWIKVHQIWEHVGEIGESLMIDKFLSDC